MIYNCCNENRKGLVLNNPSLNGINYLEVLDQEAKALGIARQQTLLVYCLNPAPSSVGSANVLIQGGESVTAITVDWVCTVSNLPASESHLKNYLLGQPNNDLILAVRVHPAGDFSPYTLRIVNQAALAQGDPFGVTEVLTGFDPLLSEVEFSFKVECGPDFDCAPAVPACPPDAPAPPPINYQAKDFGSFQTLLQDRLSQLLPGWSGSSEADLGVALVELMSYVGDQLSYQQDAVTTEAYLETARSRISLRRHALLVDYHVHDGCNARAWVQMNVSGNPGVSVALDRTKTRFYNYAPGMPSTLAVGSGNEEAALASGVQVFEPLQNAVLYPEHNLLFFYTWGDTGCCLPQGATEATLQGTYPNLQAGDVLVFKEVMGPQTGDSADADIRHRCAVRLTRVAIQNGQGQPLVDPLYDATGAPITNTATQKPAPVTEIQWSPEDALPFPLCLSSTILDSNGDSQSLTGVSVALGNVVLADHGLSLAGKHLGTVPQPRLFIPPNPSMDTCQPVPPTPIPPRFYPQVPDSPLTQQVPLADRPDGLQIDPSLSATQALATEPDEAVPVITLTSTFDGQSNTWNALQDLLESGESDQVFVVEVESDGTATLRFGDDTNGLQPDPGTSFTAAYRIGNGSAGNLGADSLVYLAAADARILSCDNPLPAQGGVDPETNDQIRRRAPQAFLTQERAVIPADYQTLAQMNSQVDRASAAIRWTGSWYTAFVTVEPEGGGDLSPALQTSLQTTLEGCRMAGQDLQLESPQYVSLEIAFTVCVDPNYFQSDVQKALLQVLSNQALANGQKGVFYPDNFTFGQTVYLSPLYAAARSVAGVVSVTATVFQIQGIDTPQYLASGEIELGPLQVARLDNDPSLPDHGRLTLKMEGGK